MATVTIKSSGSGTGNFTLEPPTTNTDRNLVLPDEAGKFLTDSGALNVDPSAPTQSATIDSSGRLLVGTTDPFPVSIGETDPCVVLGVDGAILSTATGRHIFNRVGTDGDIIAFRKEGSKVGSIANNGTDDLKFLGTNYITIGAGDTGLRFYNALDSVFPVNATTSIDRDNAIDLGRSSVRFDDIYATNGTIQTSDINEKQDIEELTDAEARVAAKAKILLRKYRWKSAVEEKGEEARIHFGIIAQDLEQAFIDEGLDAGRYGMFIRGEWYEAEVEKTRTVKNDDGTKTTETYMATETYDSAEEASADAVHKERLGVRYHELLAFIIAAI